MTLCQDILYARLFFAWQWALGHLYGLNSHFPYMIRYVFLPFKGHVGVKQAMAERLHTMREASVKKSSKRFATAVTGGAGVATPAAARR